MRVSHYCDISPHHGWLMCHRDMLLTSDDADINTVSAVNTGGNSSRWDCRGGKADELDVIFGRLSRSRRFFCLIITRYFLLITKRGDCSIYSAGAEHSMPLVRCHLRTWAIHLLLPLLLPFPHNHFKLAFHLKIFYYYYSFSPDHWLVIGGLTPAQRALRGTRTTLPQHFALMTGISLFFSLTSIYYESLTKDYFIFIFFNHWISWQNNQFAHTSSTHSQNRVSDLLVSGDGCHEPRLSFISGRGRASGVEMKNQSYPTGLMQSLIWYIYCS